VRPWTASQGAVGDLGVGPHLTIYGGALPGFPPGDLAPDCVKLLIEVWLRDCCLARSEAVPDPVR
jgi:hypothetical protein